MPVDLGQRIRTLRQPNGVARYTQREVGDAIGVDAISVSRWERGAAEPKPVHLRALARFFDVPVSYFYDEVAA